MKTVRGLLLAASAIMALPASAATISYNVSGTNLAGQAVSASLTFVTGANTLNIYTVNSTVNPTSVAQNISGISFVLSTGQTSGSISGQSNNTSRSIAGNKTYSDNVAFTSQWGTLSNAFLPGGMTICVIGLAANSCSETANQAEQTIVGQPGAGNTYSNANGSIAGNGAHNPFLYGSVADPVQFTMAISGVTVNSLISSIRVNFGTELEYGVTCTPPNICRDRDVPEPGTLALFGLGLLGLGLRRRPSEV